MVAGGGSAPRSPASPRTIRNSTGDVNVKPTNVPLSPTNSPMGRRSFYDRTFSKLQKGSLRGAIFNLCSAAIGGGVLSLSYVFVLSGWAIGLILLVLGGIAGVMSNRILTNTAINLGLRNYDEICFRAGGDLLRKALQVFMLLYVFGACIGYQVLICQMIQYVIEGFGV